MPKIIPNVRQNIIDSAKEQIQKDGFNGLSLRRIAKDCNIALGTTYNYFPSKSELLHIVVESDWTDMMENFRKERAKISNPDEIIFLLYQKLRKFVQKYGVLIDTSSKTFAAKQVSEDHMSFLYDKTEEVLSETVSELNIKQPKSLTSLEAEMMVASSIRKQTEESDVKHIIQKLCSPSPSPAA